MLSQSLRRLWLLSGAAVLAACDSTPTDSTPTERSLYLQGGIVEAGGAPFVPLGVTVQAWLPGSGEFTQRIETDTEGRYEVALDPTVATLVDSVRVEVLQPTCGQTFATSFTERHIDATVGDTLSLPTLTLPAPGPPALLFTGEASCAGIIVVPPVEGGLGDFLKLTLWHDDLGDSPQGRWEMSHQATTATDEGYFDGTRTATRLELVLHSSFVGCGDLTLEIRTDGSFGDGLGAAELAHGGECFVPPHLRARFFDGTLVGSQLPPLGE